MNPPSEGALVASDASAVKKMRLRYAGTCRSCGVDLPGGAPAFYDRVSKTVQCLVCPEKETGQAGSGNTVTAADPVPGSRVTPATPPGNDAAELAVGVAGASARREFERRRDRRERNIRSRHPRIGGLILALSDEPQSTTAWAVGANGEQALGQRLDSLAGPTVRVLHDRRIPPTRANIDHIVVCPAGVYVIDAKQYKGRPHLRIDGGFLRERTETFMVGSRDCTKLVDGVLKQVDLVRATVSDEGTPVRGFLCFVAADWPLFGSAFSTRGVTALWPKKLSGVIAEPGHLTDDRIRAVHGQLANALPIA